MSSNHASGTKETGPRKNGGRNSRRGDEDDDGPQSLRPPNRLFVGDAPAPSSFSYGIDDEGPEEFSVSTAEFRELHQIEPTEQGESKKKRVEDFADDGPEEFPEDDENERIRCMTPNENDAKDIGRVEKMTRLEKTTAYGTGGLPAKDTKSSGAGGPEIQRDIVSPSNFRTTKNVEKAPHTTTRNIEHGANHQNLKELARLEIQSDFVAPLPPASFQTTSKEGKKKKQTVSSSSHHGHPREIEEDDTSQVVSVHDHDPPLPELAGDESYEGDEDDDEVRPGAFRVGAFGEESVVGTTATTDQETFHTQEGQQPLNEPGDGVLLQAQLVRTELVEAKPDPWWRRYQWWLAGIFFSLLIGITLAVVFTIVDLGSSPAVLLSVVPSAGPTNAPTSILDGLETEITQIIVSALIAAGIPADPLLISDNITTITPQSQALQWLTLHTLTKDFLHHSNRTILQKYSLATLAYSTSYNGWINAGEWLESANECQWYGVECDGVLMSEEESTPERELVTGIFLAANGLDGTLLPDIGILANSLGVLDLSNNTNVGRIPSELGLLGRLSRLNLSFSGLNRTNLPTTLGLLTNLVDLDISGNLLSSTLPSELGRLTKLTSVNAAVNDLQGSIPSEVGLLTRIVFLDLSYNKLNFAVPSQIGVLSVMQHFDAHDNSLQGSLPSEVGMLTSSLSFLDLHRNSLANTIPREIGSLAELTYLDMSDNQFTGSVPQSFGTLSMLTVLRMNKNFFSGSIHSSIGALDLIVLDISDNKLTRPLPSQIWDIHTLVVFNISRNGNLFTTMPSQINLMSTLRILDLSSTSTSSTIPTEIGLITTMEWFDIRSTRVGGTVPSQIGEMTRLEWIDLGFNRISGSIPTEVGSLTALRSLQFSDQDQDAQAINGPIPTQVGYLTSLTSLILTYTDISGSIPKQIGNLVSLEVLNLLGINTWGEIPATIGFLTNLRYLSLLFAGNVVGPIPTTIGSLTSLEELDFRYMSRLNDIIPSEVGLMTNLKRFLFYNNAIWGSIPTQVGRLTEIRHFEIQVNRMVVGPIPSEIGGLTKMTSLILQSTGISGALPSEIGLLTSLEVLALSVTNLVGKIPLEIARLTNLQSLWLGAPGLTGSIPESLCNTTMTIFVLCDEGNVFCSCCGCPGTVPTNVPSVSESPSPFPSIYPSATLTPSLAGFVASAQPSSQPVASPSVIPSVMPAEGSARTCSPYSSIATTGTILSISNTDDGNELVTLPFSFMWRGTMAYNQITVNANGVIFPGDQPTLTGCCSPFPIVTGGTYNAPRIAVAQEDMSPNLFGSVHVGTEKNDVFIISWEQVSHSTGFFVDSFFDFQAALHADGSIEFRWGSADPPLGVSVASGLEDDGVGMAVPVTGAPFVADGNGLTAEGTWPTGQCRFFSVVSAGSTGSYTESSL